MRYITTSIKTMGCLLLLCGISFGQVGIGNSTPEGILDLNKTDDSENNQGFIYPTAELTSTQVQAPVVNPQGGVLAPGTTIFNTARTGSGAFDVEPGIYSWDGDSWVTHFYKRETQEYVQTTLLRTETDAGYQEVPGLDTATANTFEPVYSGTYRIEAKGYYGAGRVVTSAGINALMGTGTWRLTFNGTDYFTDTSAISSYHPSGSGMGHYVDIWVETVMVQYVTLIAGNTYNLSLAFDQTSTEDSLGFVNNGNSGQGRGYVGSEVSCHIEFTYLNQ